MTFCHVLLLDYRPLVLFAVGHEIRKFVPGIKDYEYDDVLTSGKRIQSLAVDVTRNFIYWTDSSVKTIMRAIIAPKNSRHLAHPQDLHIGGIITPKGIAFDWVARFVCLFVTDQIQSFCRYYYNVMNYCTVQVNHICYQAVVSC